MHELLEGWQGYAWPGEALRFNMLRTQYRQPLDWTLVGLDEAHKTLWEWYGDLEGKEPATGVPGPVLDALMDDLNTPKAITELHRLHSAGHWGGLRAALGFLGFSGERANIGRAASAAGTAPLSFRRPKPSWRAGSARATPRGRRRISRRRTASAASSKPWASSLKDAKDPKTGELTTTWEVAR